MRDSREQKRRGTQARVIVSTLLGFLLIVLFRNQVLGFSEWLLQSESNRLRALTVPAPRGIIWDRSGRALADNVPAYAVWIQSSRTESMIATLDRLRAHMTLSDERHEFLTREARANPYRRLLVSKDAPFDAVAALEERRSAFPGVVVEYRPKRRYPEGELGAHVVGYVGQINEEELNSPDFEGAGPGTMVGRSGIEAMYDQGLRGKAGTRYVEVDALGRIVASFRGLSRVPEEAGADLELNLDLELMEWVHYIFPEGMNGALVALEVETGGVLALYSMPSFDPNLFTGEVDAAVWNQLLEHPGSPLVHRAVAGKYAPGSTWKLASAAIALEAGVVTPGERMPVSCRGSFQFGSRAYRCWLPEGHGSQDLAGAIRNSCNVYFYQLGLRVGLERMLEAGNRMGFGGQCNIDLPQEAAGTFPESKLFWERRFGYEASEGEVLNLVLGQGPNSQTPLKMAQFYLAIARDGSAPAPSLNRFAEAGEGWRLDISPEDLETLRYGLRQVVEPGGTAYMASLEHFDLMGKTGTAQSGGDRLSHAWFAGMAGLRDGPPEIVVVALVEFGGSGSDTAAPLVAKTADFYLRAKHGIPRDTIQTLSEYLRAGRNTAWANRRPDR